MLEGEAQNVVVSDLRMPGVDGATLLARVRELDPAAVRIVLSGQADLEMLARAAGVAHRLLAKPCEVDDLVEMIDRSCALQELITRVESEAPHGRLLGASVGPPPVRAADRPAVLAAKHPPRTPRRSSRRTWRWRPRCSSSRTRPTSGAASRWPKLRDAVAYLGLDALRALALSAAVFQEFRVDPPIPRFDLEALQLHCSRVAHLARAIAAEREQPMDVFAAGLLHDVGLLVLATEDRDALTEILAAAEAEQRPTARGRAVSFTSAATPRSARTCSRCGGSAVPR